MIRLAHYKLLYEQIAIKKPLASRSKGRLQQRGQLYSIPKNVLENIDF